MYYINNLDIYKSMYYKIDATLDQFCRNLGYNNVVCHWLIICVGKIIFSFIKLFKLQIRKSKT